MIIQLALFACLLPFVMLGQDLQQAHARQQAAVWARTLLAQHQALQQYCAVRPDPPAPQEPPPPCRTPGAIARAPTLNAYLDPALAASPYLPAVQSLYDGQHTLSYLDLNQAANGKGGWLTGRIDAEWIRVSAGSVCAGIYRNGRLICADGSTLTINGGAGPIPIPDGSPMVADP
ncbi:hypothetical protein [Paludibacterium sp.]|uniref:hypothetical protein n=1 Tax=Paludibacterium sp. TaxID=1917523 RepID=UPI0025E86BD0|nr:hypothetical protein [Paludibacterium sp.]MBV8645835.1 hypothetical protein [Paludibacterium sp.]